jgi:uncharacterized membrane protein (UPF0182 family)
MLRTLKFVAALLINVVVAIIGTAILDTTLGRMIPSHSFAALVWKECGLSVICAAFIGFGMWRTWRSSAAKWTWVIPAVWFTVGFLAIAGRGNVWGRIFGFGSGSNFGAAEARTFFLFTVPLIRAVFYSVGAYVSSLRYPAPAVNPMVGEKSPFH